MIEKGVPADVVKRINAAYSKALRQIVKENKRFLRKVEGVLNGTIEPPAYYILTDKVDVWKQGFLREALRQNEVIERIMARVDAAGQKSAGSIRNAMADLFVDEKRMQIDILVNGAKKYGITPDFGLVDKRAAAIAISDKQPVFSKIAYNNLGQNVRVRERLQNELAQAILKGEGQEKIVRRIRNVVGEANYNAERTAQTESTRVRAQARQEAAEEAEEMGLQIERVWHCRFMNTRDSHADMEGQTVNGADTPFISGAGNQLLYPGDPLAPAGEVINCRCYVVSRVKSGSVALTRIRSDYEYKRAKRRSD